MPGTERRLSTSSEDANAPPQRQLSQDGTEIIPTRMSKVTTPKPASNPLQFIKTGPCDLYKAAQEQIKKVEEIKKVEKVKDDSEDWQSNLDNWKCSRRKRQEHIIERVVEVKKLELEEHDRNRRRSKTFNEMMEERNSKGGLRKMSILSFSEEDSNDLSDLGLTSNKEKSGGDFTSEQNGSSKHHTNANDQKSVNKTNGHNNNNNNKNNSAYDDGGSSTPATISSPEPEEYTYERAIQNYMDFAEAKVKTTGKPAKEKGVNGTVNFRICSMKKEPGGKIGEKLSELEQIRLRSKSTNDISGGNEAKQLPKVDVLKRRSLFENADAADATAVKSNDRVPKDLSNAKTIKERLSNLEKNNEKTAKVNRSSGEVGSHIKDTIENLEKQKAVNGNATSKRLSNGDVQPQISIKERLNSLEKQNNEEGTAKCRIPSEGVSPVSLKERMMSYDEATAKTSTPKLEPERDAAFKEKLETFKLTEKCQNDVVNSITGNSSNNCSDSIQNFVKAVEGGAEKREKPETGFEQSVGAQKPEELTQNTSGFNETEPKPRIESSEPVSSTDDVKSVVVVNAEEMEKSGSELVDLKSKEMENETENMTEVEKMVGENVGNTNKKSVEDDRSEGVFLTNTKGVPCFYTLSPVANLPKRKNSDVPKTIVTHISLPDCTKVPGPRVNISVSIDSLGKKDSVSNSGEDEDEASDEFPDAVSNLRISPSLLTSKNPQKTRVRKLTPMISAPQICPGSPLKTVCELQIIEEGENPEQFEEERKSIAVHMSPGNVRGTDNEVQEIASSKMSNGKDEETSKFDCKTNGPREDEDFAGEDGQDESAQMYTDENIEEVLGKDDDDEDEEDELETMVDEDPRYEPVTEEVKIQKELEIFTPKDSSEVLIPLKPVELLEKPMLLGCGNYENIYITNQIPQLNASPDSDIYATLSFPLGSRPTIEPPKEKPPPPPLDLSDEESNKPELPPKPSLRRLDSTKRIKKEIRKKRSDFLGIEGLNDDSYLEPEIYVAPPPDMMTFLQEERRLEQQLYRQSICSESDSNHETAESRDSGVELDRGHVDDICWSKPDVMSEPHSRQNSETFGNTSITSEEDEILKKEREIIEVLEKEEQWRYGNKNSHGTEQNDIGEKLAVKLRQLEQEKMQLERERAEEEDRRKAEETARRRNEQQLIVKQQQLRQQENSSSLSNKDSSPSSTIEQEALRFERERLHKEQEHLERCRQNLMEQQQNPEQGDVYHRNASHWDTPSNRHSLQEVPIGLPMVDVPRHSMQDVSQPQYPSQMSSGYRYSLPDLQQREARSTRPPPPIPPAKPIRPMTQEQWERETNIRNSRIPSADNIPLQIEASSKLRHGSSVPAININHGGQQMTRSTLHALSAAPRSRIISNENWMQPKRKADAPKSNYNYQHWLIQEAEHRRILEHQQKVSQQLQSKRQLPYNGQMSSATYGGSPPSHHTVGLPISPPVQSGQPNQKWVSPPRTEKPLPDSVIQTLTQRVQNRENKNVPRRRTENAGAQLPNKMSPSNPETHPSMNSSGQSQERMLSVSGKKKCSHCNEELGRGAAMIIESLRLFYHIDCFKCCVCHVQLGDGLMGTDVRVRNNKLHCHNCYSSDDGKAVAWKGAVEDEEENMKKIKEEIFRGGNKEKGNCNGSHNFDPSCLKINFFPEAMTCDSVPDWFKEFYTNFLQYECQKYEVLEDVFLRMIDFEIEKCELLRDIISKLKS